MAGINRVSGLASGLDVDQIVSDLMKAQRMRLDKVIQDRQIWQWKQEDYRSLNASLLSLRNVVSNLRLQSSFLAKKATSSDEGIVTAAAGGNAVSTSYLVKVESLATIATNASAAAITKEGFVIDPDAPLASQESKFANSFGWDTDHTFSFTINGQTFTFDGDTDSLNKVIATVNANKAAGVSMFYDATTDRIAISTIKTGDNQEGAEIQVEDVTGSFMTGVLQIEEANEKGGTDASFEINGLAITSHTNSYTVNGVTFNFWGADPGRTVTVSVAHDVDAVVDTVKSFVDK
ncbi:flagellar hook 2 domain-containing protein [Thermacetogenium phaeum DSM 12270]|uniref:Filament cap protein n=1 Tax=Thermacetogenium phaeum (strain ATCC BAA-254 / DSM 26808 / PB) TaxID=1089553 RepID=K4LWP4_THEPS|nr:flagellar filament capping protein FliD [Thermacetogenium phaeum]AFV12409.1 flagellar hook 2 domain-containing protein [Thermacetogenium phaeum DSM 12270]